MRISADDDAALVARVRAGDPDAYAVLVRRHAPLAMRTAALLGAGANAEDVVQEALVKAYSSLDRFHDDRPFRPWLLRIVNMLWENSERYQRITPDVREALDSREHEHHGGHHSGPTSQSVSHRVSPHSFLVDGIATGD